MTRRLLLISKQWYSHIFVIFRNSASVTSGEKYGLYQPSEHTDQRDMAGCRQILLVGRKYYVRKVLSIM